MAAVAAMVFVAFSACKPVEPIDNRDQFIGTYDIVITGSLTFSGLGTLPMDEVGVLTITKDNTSESLVNLSGAYSGKATVTGNSIKIDQMIETGVIDGFNVQLTISPRSGTLNGAILTFVTDVSATMSYGGSTYVGNGVVQNVATKR